MGVGGWSGVSGFEKPLRTCDVDSSVGFQDGDLLGYRRWRHSDRAMGGGQPGCVSDEWAD